MCNRFAVAGLCGRSNISGGTVLGLAHIACVHTIAIHRGTTVGQHFLIGFLCCMGGYVAGGSGCIHLDGNTVYVAAVLHISDIIAIEMVGVSTIFLAIDGERA